MVKLIQGTRVHKNSTLKAKPKNPKALKKLALATIITVFAGCIYIAAYPHTYDAKQAQELEHKTQRLEQTIKQLNQQQVKSQQQQTTLEQTQKQLQETQQKLEAKAKSSTARAYAAVIPPTYRDNCAQWVTDAGITDYANAMNLIRGESNCRPEALNSSSGACGVAQELPCGKSGCSRTDGACQVRWMNIYVLGRYGSWANAYQTWLGRSPHWY
jgi:uncharacterized coiled-coil protein SlyX